MWVRFPGLERLEDGFALTFDDGPDPDSTPAVLDALDAAGARATFFLVGEQLLVHHDLAAEVVRRGHAVGCHGFRHEAMDRRTADEVREDLQRALDSIEAACGLRPAAFRPPYGRLGEEAHHAVGELGLELVWWSAWGMDWEQLGAERIVELVRRDLLPGAVVLLHDSPRYGHRSSARPTAEAIPALVDAASQKGLEPVLIRGERADGA